MQINPDEPQAFLASVTYPTDLVIKAFDPEAPRVGPGRPAWWVIGRSRAPERWAQRIMEVRQTQEQQSGVHLVPLHTTVSSEWSSARQLQKAEREIVSMVTDRAAPVVRCA